MSNSSVVILDTTHPPSSKRKRHHAADHGDTDDENLKTVQCIFKNLIKKKTSLQKEKQQFIDEIKGLNDDIKNLNDELSKAHSEAVSNTNEICYLKEQLNSKTSDANRYRLERNELRDKLKKIFKSTCESLMNTKELLTGHKEIEATECILCNSDVFELAEEGKHVGLYRCPSCHWANKVCNRSECLYAWKNGPRQGICMGQNCGQKIV